MPFGEIRFPAGITTESSKTLTGPAWDSANLIRWQYGQPQKLGGWQRLSQNTFVGVCRGMHGWADLLGNGYVGIGTDQRLEVYTGGAIFDITPVITTTNTAPNFSTVNTTNSVKVTQTAHGASVGDWINIVATITVGGIILQGFYRVATIVDANNFTINATASATSTVNNAGATAAFTTTITDSHVSTALANHGFSQGQAFTVHVSTAVGGLTLFGQYLITSITNANTFVFDAVSLATSGATASENAGNARIQYLLPSGFAVTTVQQGYGTGTYGSGVYGGPGTGVTTTPAREWFLDNWGQLLIGNPTNGAIYVWTPPDTTTPAQVVATAPAKSTASFVIAQSQILVSLGAETGGQQFPNLIRWSDVADYTDFIPTQTNQAGSFNIPSGSKIVAGIALGLGALIWTDIDVWSMTYQGLPFVFGFNKVASNCEAISGRAPAVIGNMVMWPSQRGFFRYDGGAVVPVPCPVWSFFFENVNYGQVAQITSATNTLFSEIAWFFPFNDGSGNIGYVKYNLMQAQLGGDLTAWDIGILPRTAWIDHGAVGNPIGADTTGLLQQHEVGNDADGVPMLPMVTSGLAALGDGENYWFIDQVIPDFQTNKTNATITLSLLATNYPGDQAQTYGPFTLTTNDGGTGTEWVPVRVRGRQIGFTISSSDVGSFWRLGLIRYRFRPAGRN